MIKVTIDGKEIITDSISVEALTSLGEVTMEIDADNINFITDETECNTSIKRLAFD